MKKSLHLIMLFMLAVTFNTSIAQCVINTSNTTAGFTPSTLPCITQGTAYAQATQLHVPSSVDYMGTNYPVTSVQITNITGMPTGINYSVNPTTAIPGNGNGCVDFFGTTSNAAASYPLTVSATAVIPGVGPIPITFDQVGYSLSLCVSAGGGGGTTCDTLSNITAGTSLYVFSIDTGYFAGNNKYGDLAKAEKYTATAGSTLSGALISFGYAVSPNPSRLITVNAWDATGTGGAPGAIIASKTVSLASIIADINAARLTSITFTSPVTLTGTAYYIGVTLPTTFGDTVAIATTDVYAAGQGWEKWSNNSWNSYASVYAPDNYSHAMYPIVCTTPPTVAPVAAFTANTTSGCGPLSVTFADQSTNTPTSWSWSFPGGTPTTSTVKNPTVVYNTPGNYSVTLTATNATGASTPLTKTNYITVTGVCPATCDTIFNFDFSDSLTIYRTPSPATGFLTGSSSLGDLGRAEKFTTTAGYQLSNAIAAVYYKGNANTSVTFSVYDATGAGGSPGTVLGSTTRTFSSLSNQNFNNISFSPAITLPANFFIGVSLPTSVGDTFALFGSTIYDDFPGGWIRTSTGSWIDYVARYNFDFTHGLVAISCPPTGSVPVANFSANTTSGCAPLSVAFSDLSTNTPTSWSWSFPGGTPSTSTVKNPTVVYSTAGTYNVTLTATNATGASTPVTKSSYITVNPKPVVTLTKTDATCTQAGSVTSTVTGGSGFTYLWTNQATTANINPATPGTYNVTVTNANSCTGVGTAVTVAAAPSISVTLTKVDAVCNQANGTVTTSVTGGSGYTYSWSNNTNNANLSNVIPGTYSVTVTSANGCTAVASATVGNTGGISVSLAKVDAVCNQANGSVTSTTTGGAGYTYLWTNSATTSNITNVTPGTYAVTVTASNGCTATASSTVGNTGGITTTLTHTNTTCNQANGSVTSTTTGGSGYTYLWSNSATTQNLTNVGPGTYSVTVTSTNGCTTSASNTVTATPSSLSATASTTTTPACGQSNGVVSVTATGGTTPYSYAWNTNPVQTTQSATNLPAGSYTVTVSDNGGCSVTSIVNLTNTGGPTAAIAGTSSICAGGSTQLTASGGGTYQWSNGLGSNPQINVSPSVNTTYTVTVTANGNCIATATKTVVVNQTGSSVISKTICSGNTFTFNGVALSATGTYRDTLLTSASCDSFVTLNLTVNPPLTGSYSKTICSGSPLVFNGQALTSSGAYKDTIQTSGGCDSIVTLFLTVNPPLTGSFSVTRCSGSPYIFNGQSLTSSGAYKDTIQTSGGCDSILTLNLTVNPALTGSFSKSICAGDNFVFNGQALTAPGSYKDTIQTSGGCDSIVTLVLTINPLPTPTISQSGSVLSTQNFSSYQWLAGGTAINNATNQSFTATGGGTYSVVVTDANGCSNTSSAVVLVGINETNGSALKFALYPNPTERIINVEVEGATANEFKLTITNYQGQQVAVTLVEGNKQVIDVANYPAGVYLVEIKSGSNVSRTRFTKL